MIFLDLAIKWLDILFFVLCICHESVEFLKIISVMFLHEDIYDFNVVVLPNVQQSSVFVRKWHNIFHMTDRAVIYIFIASSYTPWQVVCLHTV